MFIWLHKHKITDYIGRHRIDSGPGRHRSDPLSRTTLLEDRDRAPARVDPGPWYISESSHDSCLGSSNLHPS